MRSSSPHPRLCSAEPHPRLRKKFAVDAGKKFCDDDRAENFSRAIAGWKNSMAKYFYDSMTHREVQKYIREGFARLGLVYPEKNYWWDQTSSRPTRGDIVAMMLHQISTRPETSAAKKSLDMLILWCHPDMSERKAAAARQGSLWDDQLNLPINDYGHALTSDLIQAGLPEGRKRLH